MALKKTPFHSVEIPVGEYGKVSKIYEEVMEALDAENQGHDLMLLIELSDIIGAVNGVAQKFGFTLEQLKKFAELRSEVAKVGFHYENVSIPTENKKYKELIYVLSEYRCNKNCPFCISKMIHTHDDFLVDDNFSALDQLLMKLEKEGQTFDYFVLSGNGEPSFYDLSKLSVVTSFLSEYKNMFKQKRIQTSGHLFYCKEHWELFKDWLIEVTRYSYDSVEDMNVLKYSQNYLNSDLFKKSKIRLNIILKKEYLLEENSLSNEIFSYNTEYNNIKEIALKILDKTEKRNTQTDWITEHGIDYTELSPIIAELISTFGMYKTIGSNLYWKYGNIQISLYNNIEYIDRNDQNDHHIMLYGDKVTDK